MRRGQPDPAWDTTATGLCWQPLSCASALAARSIGRRAFLGMMGGAAIGLGGEAGFVNAEESGSSLAPTSNCITLFLAGDVMAGRGVDQILPSPGDPRLFEPFLRSAIDYVKLTEQKAGRIPRPVEFTDVWGDALDEWARVRPDVRIVNLETAITVSNEADLRKGIHYRMHPKNAAVLSAAGIDCCVLANNHVLDWGQSGLTETLQTLRGLGIQTTGAGRDEAEAAAPIAIDVPYKGRVLVFSWAVASSGVTRDWSARAGYPGINFLANLLPRSVDEVVRSVRQAKRPGDIAVASFHWGGNWGFRIFEDEREFAHRIIDEAGVDIVHGHSSHHVKGIEVYRDRPIIYGSGDLVNDYEGIGGYDKYRSELALMYFPSIDPATGQMKSLVMTPMERRRMSLRRASEEGEMWLRDTLNRESESLGAQVTVGLGGSLNLQLR